MGAYQTILWSLMNDSDSKGVTLSEWLIGAYRSVLFRYLVLEYKGLLLLYPLLALVVSALLNSQYTEFHLEYVDYDLRIQYAGYSPAIPRNLLTRGYEPGSLG